MRKTAFIYSDDFSKFEYGSTHPLKTFRLKLTFDLINAYGLLSLPNTKLIQAEPANEEDLQTFHARGYIELLKILNNGRPKPIAELFGIGPGDNPIFEGMYDWSRLVAGASLQAASLVSTGIVDIAFNIAGGLHHAMPTHASGFCYINDPAITIKSLLKRGYRVAYIDIDAHHGDGVQNAFYESNKVLTISIHETGTSLFPYTGFEKEIGEGEGKGYTVNIPMPPGAGDDLFLRAFDEIVPPIIEKYQPDIVVSQLGVDSFYNDLLSHLNYTIKGFCETVKKIKSFAKKWIALGGGGYNMANVAKAWTLAWSVMNDVEIPDEIPQDYLERYSKYGFQNNKLRDEFLREDIRNKENMIEEVERVITYIKKHVFPIIVGN